MTMASQQYNEVAADEGAGPARQGNDFKERVDRMISDVKMEAEAALRLVGLMREMKVGVWGLAMALELAPLAEQVTLFTHTAEMERAATQALAQAGHGNALVRLAEKPPLPCEDGALDVVVAHHELRFCQDPAGAIREMVRVLRPGGALALTGLDPYDLGPDAEESYTGPAYDWQTVQQWLEDAGLYDVMVRGVGPVCQAELLRQDGSRRTVDLEVYVAGGVKR